MKNLDCLQIENFINLEIIGEEDKNKNKKTKKKIIYTFKNLTNFYNLVKSRVTTITSKTQLLLYSI